MPAEPTTLTPSQREIGARAADKWPKGFGLDAAVKNVGGQWKPTYRMEEPGVLL